MPKVGHIVTRPGRREQDPPVEIPVAEELETTPGIPKHESDLEFYSREYPLETINIDERASRDWANRIRDGHLEMREIRREHDRLNKPIVMAGRMTGDMEPTSEPTGEDVTELIKAKARSLGFGEVGVTRYDHHYTYVSKKDWVKFPHAICLAYEQDYEPTQSIPSVPAEIVHSSTYRTEGAAGLELGNYIRSLGYRAQVHSPNDNTGPYIPMFVEAGLGQLGANGQLLSPHFGSRARLMVITTDAAVYLRQAGGLRHPSVLQHLPGMRQPLSRQGHHPRQDLVARCREEQAHLQALPARHGPLSWLRHLHEGLPHPEVRHEASHGTLHLHR